MRTGKIVQGLRDSSGMIIYANLSLSKKKSENGNKRSELLRFGKTWKNQQWCSCCKMRTTQFECTGKVHPQPYCFLDQAPQFKTTVSRRGTSCLPPKRGRCLLAKPNLLLCHFFYNLGEDRPVSCWLELLMERSWCTGLRSLSLHHKIFPEIIVLFLLWCY